MGVESRLIAFYRGGEDDSGRRLDDILKWDHHRLESTHDYIQWMFPLTERSLANPSAPVLSSEDVRLFRREPPLQQRMLDALGVMRAFYRLDDRGPYPWLEHGNHNYLRLTRMLRSLRTVGLESQARGLFDSLTALYHAHQGDIGATTYGYWERAMTDHVAF